MKLPDPTESLASPSGVAASSDVQRAMVSDTETKGNPVNLITAVLTNSVMRERLASMPSDEKTVVLSGDALASSTLAHPAWRENHFDGDAPTNSDENETVELPLKTGIGSLDQPTDFVPKTPCKDRGFVPKRRVATIGGVNIPAGVERCEIDYRLVGQLGAGGTGIVYQAHQRAIDREVAIKALRGNLAVDPASRERFLTEARVIGGLDHPNVIALHEVCIDQDGGLFYSMKRIDGTSWDQQINEKSISENVQILTRVADAIRYAHSRGLVHRDIKPENVMLGRFGEVLLADWGLAISHNPSQNLDEEVGGLAHSIGGTPAYMAPELATGNARHVSFATDVYLLGAVLFQIKTGFPPHHGETLLECIQAAAENKIRPTSIKGELLDIAIKAMATSPADRYASVDDFLTAIHLQREHEESTRLVKRVNEHLSKATAENHYEDFRVADALLREALEIWPQNRRAEEARVDLNLQFAAAATEQGDLDLAVSLYDAVGLGDSERASRVRRERDQRDATLQRESRYSVLFTHSPDAGLLVRISSGRVIEANQTFGDLMGYTEDEVVGKLMHELNLWECPNRRDELLAALEKEGRIDNFDAQILHRDGTPIDVLISARMTTINGEKLLISSIRDISLRKKAENELRQNRRRLRDLQALAGLATWSYDVQTKKVTWSDEAFVLAGRERAEGTPTMTEYMDLIHPQDRKIMKESITTAIKSGAAYEISIRQRGAQSRYRTLVVRGQPIFDESGKTTEVYGVLIPQKV
ncbi:protein kinase domain-containing protein [Novipirellula herctigrandis]